LAAVTRKVRVGSLVLCNSYRNPALTAKMAASLDFISGGRLEFGYGAGWKKDEYMAYGFPWHDTPVRAEQMAEAIRLMKGMWTEEPFSFRGKYYAVKDAVCNPKPLQKPHPPIWIGGGGEKIMLRLVAGYADGWNSGLYSPEVLKRKMEVLRAHCEDVGRSFGAIEKSWHGHVYVSPSEEKNSRFFNAWVETFRLRRDPWLGRMSKEELRRSCVIGAPEECIQKVQEYVDVGVTHFMTFFLDFPSLESMKLFADKVMPHFR